MSNQTFPLLSTEAEELQQLEAVIQTRLTNFIEVGEALSKIKDGKLYRATHDTFESYCRERWNLSRYYAHRLIESAVVVEMLPAGNKSEITSERQAREIAKVEPEKRAEVIEKAKESTGGKITAAALKAAANPAPVAPPAEPPAMSTPTAPENAPEATEQPANGAPWSLPKWGDKMRSCFHTLINAVADEHRAEAKWLAAKIAAEVFAPSADDPKPEPWGPAKTVPPLPEWVTAYSASIGYPMNGQAWCDGYAQKGWLVGKAKMKDWQAAARNWKTNGWGLGNVALAQRKPDAPRKEYKL